MVKFGYLIGISCLLICYSLVEGVSSRILARDDRQVSIRLEFEGGSENCSICHQQDGIYFNSSFACSDGSNGDWNDGNIDFEDPIPPHHVLIQVAASLVGRYNTKYQLEGCELIIILESGIVNISRTPKDPEGYFCPHCAVRVNATSKPIFAGWSGYRYGTTNTLSIDIADDRNDICLNFVDLTLFYVPANPNIYNLVPNSGPISGNTSVIVWGNTFYDSVQYKCLFGQHSEPRPAQFQDNQHVRCLTPPSSDNNPQDVSFYIEVASLNPVYTNNIFTYYNEPKLLQLIPDKGTEEGNEDVFVKGTEFTKTDLLKCLWNGIPKSAQFINSTTILCISNPGKGKSFVQITQNGQDLSKNGLYFTYTKPKTKKGLQILPGWAWVVLVFGGLTSFVIIILIGIRKCNRGEIDPASRPLLSKTDSFIKQIDINNVKILNRIGKGTFGEVFRGIWNGTEVGIKFLTSPNMNEQFLNDFYKEVMIMRGLRHPNVLQFLGACTNPPDICIVMEYMPMGSLYKILHDEDIPLDREMIRKMMLDAAKGMNYLHKSDPVIIHRDLKSHNLLVDENWKVKVCDFGLSKILEAQSDFTTMTACGTPSWTAPEILRNEKYTEKADVYSFGIVLWECITREDPYDGMPPFQVVLAVGTKSMRPTIPPETPQKWAMFITECWAENQDTRPSFDQIMITLEEINLDTPIKQIDVNNLPYDNPQSTTGSNSKEF